MPQTVTPTISMAAETFGRGGFEVTEQAREQSFAERFQGFRFSESQSMPQPKVTESQVRDQIPSSRGRPLTSADYLMYNCIMDTMPDDRDVQRDFGFEKFESGHDKANLFGIYQGLRIKGITVSQLHAWQVEKTLVKNIQKTYFKIFTQYDGGYFPWSGYVPWLVDNQQRLAGTEDTTGLSQRVGDVPQGTRPFFCVPVDKTWRPSPLTRLYIALGFCVCSNETQENSLAELYRSLLAGNFSNTQPYSIAAVPSFAHFWLTVEEGKLIPLMDMCGLKEQRKTIKTSTAS